MKFQIQFNGVKTNDNGMIAEADLFAMFDDAIDAFGKLQEQYEEEADIAA